MNVIYNHKKFEKLLNDMRYNFLNASPVFKSELRIKYNDMIRTKEFLLYGLIIGGK